MERTDGSKRLTRLRQGRMVAGVCAGIGDYLGVDPNIVRILCVALAVFTGGGFALVYLVAWAVVPEEGSDKSAAESYLGKSGRELPGVAASAPAPSRGARPRALYAGPRQGAPWTRPHAAERFAADGLRPLC